MGVSLVNRLRRLEVLAGGTGPCPCCTGRAPALLRGEQEVPACETCGQALPAVRLVKVDNFYLNRQRLDALERGEEA
jgi:hypothetical protein